MLAEGWIRNILNEVEHLRKQRAELQTGANREVERRRRAEAKVEELRRHRESLRTTCGREIARRKRAVSELSVAWENAAVAHGVRATGE